MPHCPLDVPQKWPHPSLPHSRPLQSDLQPAHTGGIEINKMIERVKKKQLLRADPRKGIKWGSEDLVSSYYIIEIRAGATAPGRASAETR
jgi:hypothetical protein